MSLSKLIGFMLAVCLLASSCFASDAASDGPRVAAVAKARGRKITRPRAKRLRHMRRSGQVEVGLGYVQWTEPMTLRRLALSSTGFANYAGPALVFDVNRISGRWQISGATVLAAGSASSGGFSSDFEFSDGIRRAWYALFLHPSAAYRFNQNVMAGVGVMARLRSVDWEPNDQSISVETKSIITYQPSFNLRFTFTNLVIMQSFAASLTDNSTQWMWTVRAVF